MRTGKALEQVATLSCKQDHSSECKRPLKRKFDSVRPISGQTAANYPSPPMSDPPSPHRQPSQPSQASVGSSAPSVPMTSAAVASFASAFTFPPPQLLAYGTPSYPGNDPYRPTLSIHAGAYQAATPTFTGFHGGSSTVGGLVSSSAGTTAGPSLPRPARKSKVHVASACVNCKRAHLSCDVQRPCTRCVGSNKQDTCYDVQHKKRGRPRLREEGQFQVESMIPEPVAGPSTQPLTDSSIARPIAGTKHRRNESLRSLRSQASEGSSGSGLATPLFAPTGGMMPPPSLFPPVQRELAPSEVPTAYFDLDLRVIRANAPFQTILTGGRDLVGQHLGNFAAPADGEDFHSIRDRLRVERETVEPAYMAPMVESGVDPLQQVFEGDVDRLSRSFSDRTYTWTRNQPGAPAELFPARVRLAKAGIYFIVVTLPSFRPSTTIPSPTPTQRSPTAVRNEPFQGRRQAGLPPPPPIPHFPGTNVGLFPPPEMSVFGRSPPMATYGLPQLASPYTPYANLPSTQQLPPPSPGPRLMAEPPRVSSAYMGRPPSREPDRSLQSPIHLPPLLGSTPDQPGPSSSMSEGGRSQQVTASEEDEDGDQTSPRKRRRVVGIDDILQ